jgi:ATP-dependent DNA ligase
VEEFRALPPSRFVLDGEIVIPAGDSLSFDDLLLRIHPAESRIRLLSKQSPALYIAFDLLADGSGASLVETKLGERRTCLERFFDKLPPISRLRLSPATQDLEQAKAWFAGVGGPTDGVVAKRLDCPYLSGERTGMQKVKPIREADCVVGGFRYGTKSKLVGSLLLGLYDGDGLLHHVGFTSGLKAAEKSELTRRLEALIRPPGFTGRAPGGPSRWSTERGAEWQPLAPELVVEITYDHFTGGRFRHGTHLWRWRPDKSPRECTLDQVQIATGAAIQFLVEREQG